MSDINYFGGVIKILETPKQKILRRNTLVTKFRVQISQFYQTKIVTLVFWGNLARDVINNYKIADYLIIEGYLSLRKKKILNRTISKSRKIEITVRKIYPFFLNSNHLISKSNDYET